MKMLAMILAVAGIALAMSVPVEAMVMTCSDTAGWNRYHDSYDLVTSTDTLDGDGSIQWNKSDCTTPLTGVGKYLKSSPIDASTDGDLIEVTFKFEPDAPMSVYNGCQVRLGTDFSNYNHYDMTGDTIVPGEWEIQIADLSAPDSVVGAGMDVEAIILAQVLFTWHYSTDLAWTRLDRVAIIPEPGTMMLLALGGIAMLIRRRRRR